MNRGRRPAPVLVVFVAAPLLCAGLLGETASAQKNGSAPAGSDTRSAIEAQIGAVEREIATRRLALDEGAKGDARLASLRRLHDILQRSAESLRVSGELEAGQEETRQRAAREPRDYFRQPPPFSVPLLDAVYQSWAAQRSQAANLAQVVDHRRAELATASDDVNEAERQRRLAKDALAGTGEDDPRRAELERNLARAELASRIAVAERGLVQIELGNARIEHQMQLAAEAQAAAVLDFVRRRLAPEDADLEDVLADLEKRGFDLERALESTRLDLAAAAGRLEDAQKRADAGPDDEAALRAEELAARRLQFTASQRRVALLGERAQRLELAKLAWQRRYAALARDLDAAGVRTWIAEARKHIDDLDRQRRIKGARLAELEGDLAGLRGRMQDAVAPASDAPASARARSLHGWLASQETELAALARIYREDVANLDEVIGLETRLLGELEAHDASLPLRERIARLRAVGAEWWDYELTASDDRPITVGKVTSALLIIVMGWLFSGWLARSVGGRLMRRMGLDPGAVTAFQSLIHYGLLALVFLLALRAVAIPLTAFAVMGGALAIGVGFGSQTMVSNFISGLILLAERPIKEGDFIEVEGIYGQVERIGLRSTRVRTGDNYHIIVPNAAFLERSVINWTHANSSVRLKVSVGVAYGSPTQRVESILAEIVSAHPRVMATPAPIVLFRDFGDNSLVFEVRFWITVRDLMDRLAIESAVRHAIDERFGAERIVIAFPQRDVHIDGIGPVEVRLLRDGEPPPEPGVG